MTEVKREMKEKEKSMNQTKLSVSNLDLYYGNFHALKNINLELPEKEITAFIGPSGCGKSTLLKSLNRMNDLIEGCRITGQVLGCEFAAAQSRHGVPEAESVPDEHL